MVHYKLTYFNAKGRAELARLVFKYADVEFEDHRIERNEWPALKASMPFGQLPVLEVDGKILGQSTTFSRYLARKFGVAGKDDWEQAQSDMFVDNISDLMNSLRPLYGESDPEKMKEIMVKIITDTILPHVTIVEKHLTENGTGVLVGSEITWADLAYFGFFSFVVEKAGEGFLQAAPHFKALLKKVENHENIKKWLEVRPKTDM